MSEPQVLVTGRLFDDTGLRSIGPVIEDLIRSARSEVLMLAYLLSESAVPIVRLLESAVQKGIPLTLVVNDLETLPQTLKTRLDSLKQDYRHANILEFKGLKVEQLHAKVLVVDRKKALVGSANFTWGGLVTNHEIAVLLDGNPAWHLGNLIAKLAWELQHTRPSFSK